jgi:hypothetical protein
MRGSAGTGAVSVSVRAVSLIIHIVVRFLLMLFPETFVRVSVVQMCVAQI